MIVVMAMTMSGTARAVKITYVCRVSETEHGLDYDGGDYLLQRQTIPAVTE